MVARDDLQPPRDERGGAFDTGNFRADRSGVGLGQVTLQAGLQAYAAGLGCTRRHHEQVGAKRAQPFRHLVLSSRPDGHRAYDRRDPGDNSKRRQQTAARMGAKRLPPHPETVRGAHHQARASRPAKDQGPRPRRRRAAR